MSSSRRAEIKPADWESRLAEVSVCKDDLNRLVMDYLVVEGYRDAAETFATETGAVPLVTPESIQERTHIRDAIHSGNIQDAIERVNDLNPEILDKDPTLFFHLQQQQLIELIRMGQIHEALLFAQKVLAPHCEEHPDSLAELERTMALLAYDLGVASSPSSLSLSASPSKEASLRALGKSSPTKVQKTGGAGKRSSANKEDASSNNSGSGNNNGVPAFLSTLLHPTHRQRTAALVNAAILKSQNHGSVPKLPSLVRLLAWTEGLLDERADFPKLSVAKSLESTRV